jgi:hypothetical protein
MSRQELNAKVDELARTTDPKRRAQLIAELIEAGVMKSPTPKVLEPDDWVPTGCVRGKDGIIRTAPGVFERRFAVAAKAAGLHLWRVPRVHVPQRRLDERRPAGRRSRVRRRANAPPRPDDPEPLDVITLERFWRDVFAWLGAER